MYCVIITLLVIAAVGSLQAERNIIPSKAVCATFPNEEFAVNLGRCQNTCEFYGRNFDCPIDYRPFGDCYCKNGFARIKEYGKCVSVTKNATCAGRLPVARASCTKPNEKYSSNVEIGICDLNCLTYGCQYDPTIPNIVPKWAPNCKCQDDHRRLSNGSCVHVGDPQCVAEYQPSAGRCDALGQIYKNNAPCQPACNFETYCPPAGPTCICPADKVMYRSQVSYRTKEYIWVEEHQYGYNDYTYHSTEVMTCLYAEDCPPPITTTSVPT